MLIVVNTYLYLDCDKLDLLTWVEKGEKFDFYGSDYFREQENQ